MANLSTVATRRNTKSKNLSTKTTRKPRTKLRQNSAALAHVEMVHGIVEVLSDFGIADLLVLQEFVAKAILAKMAKAN